MKKKTEPEVCILTEPEFLKFIDSVHLAISQLNKLEQEMRDKYEPIIR